MRIFHTLFLLFSMVCLYGQTYPSDSLQRRMLDDERLFLSRMPTDLQHSHILAEREALAGAWAAGHPSRARRSPFRRRATTAAAPLPISASTPMRGAATLPRWRWEATAPEATLPSPQPSRPRA